MQRISFLAVALAAAAAPAADAAFDFDRGLPRPEGVLATLAQDEAPDSPEGKQLLSLVDIDAGSIRIRELPRGYRALGEPEVTLPVVPPPGPAKPGSGQEPPRLPPPPGSGGAVDFEKVLNIGQRIWKFIEDNKPKIETASFYANAVPSGIAHWTQLEGWGEPESTLYSFTAKNKNGATVVDVTYIILRTPQGRYKGTGRYLNGVTALPVKVNVSWGYKFSMSVDVPSVSNVGTAEAPVAGMTLNLAWTIENNFKVTKGAGIYYLQGDGMFKQLASPFAAPASR